MRDLWRPLGGASRLTWRRLIVLVEQLPPESATKAAMQDSIDPVELARSAKAGGSWNGYGPWSREALMLAEIVDRLGDVVYTIIRANGGKRPPADPYPRPGVVPKHRGRRTDPKAVAYLDQIRQRRRQQSAPDPPPEQPNG